jgi:hypothetical protein
MPLGGRRLLPTHPPCPPPFLCQFRVPSLLWLGLCLQFRLRLSSASSRFRCSITRCLLQRPRRRHTRPRQIARNPQLLRELLLPNHSRRLLNHPMGRLRPGLLPRRGSLTGSPAPSLSSSSINRRIARIRWILEMSTPRSLKISAIRWTFSPCR